VGPSQERLEKNAKAKKPQSRLLNTFQQVAGSAYTVHTKIGHFLRVNQKKLEKVRSEGIPVTMSLLTEFHYAQDRTEKKSGRDGGGGGERARMEGEDEGRMASPTEDTYQSRFWSLIGWPVASVRNSGKKISAVSPIFYCTKKNLWFQK
jgi:hypothetical protein